MTDVGGGKYFCDKCGHLAIPNDKDFKCHCRRCAELRNLDIRRAG
jgi:hypothetical protein